MDENVTPYEEPREEEPEVEEGKPNPKVTKARDDEEISSLELKSKFNEQGVKDLEELASLLANVRQRIADAETEKATATNAISEAEAIVAENTERQEELDRLHTEALSLIQKLMADTGLLRGFAVNKTAYVVRLMENVLQRSTKRLVKRIVKLDGYEPWEVCGDGNCPMVEKCKVCADEMGKALVAIGKKMKWDDVGTYIPSMYGSEGSRMLADAEYIAGLLEVLHSKKTKKLEVTN